MRITRWGEYGILCCLHIAERTELQSRDSSHTSTDGVTPIGAAEIAEKQSIPLQYAQQILHRLRKGGIIKSVRGPHGGFLLTKPANQINLREVLLAAEGQTFELICENDPIYHEACSAEQNCGLRGVWQELQTSINRLLESKTLASLHAFHPTPIQIGVGPKAAAKDSGKSSPTNSSGSKAAHTTQATE